MGRQNGRGESEQYVNMPYVLIKSRAWRSLSGAAVRVWFELSARYNGGNNGTLTLSLQEARDALGMGKATVQRAFLDLQAKGFIVLITKGSWYNRRAHEWRLTTKPLHKVEGKVAATNDWRLWQPPKTKVGSKTDPSHRSVVPFQNPKPAQRSVSEPVKGKNRAS